MHWVKQEDLDIVEMVEKHVASVLSIQEQARVYKFKSQPHHSSCDLSASRFPPIKVEDV